MMNLLGMAMAKVNLKAEAQKLTDAAKKAAESYAGWVNHEGAAEAYARAGEAWVIAGDTSAAKSCYHLSEQHYASSP